MKPNINEALNTFGRRGWTLKPYAMWGPDKPCPPRLVVNPYKGCFFQHQYCYIKFPAQKQEGFRKHLEARIEEANKAGLAGLVVMMSSSTDPFQSIERVHRDSQFAAQSLLNRGFRVLVMTRNPQMLLEREYDYVTAHPNLAIDVSIPSLEENNPHSIYHSQASAPLSETYSAIESLSKRGKAVRVKIEPIIPSVGIIQGQTKEEIDEIIRKAKETGARGIIAKTMRLNDSIPKQMYDSLIEYYTSHGINEGKTLALAPNQRRVLMDPVLEACEKYSIPFCPCVDSDTVPGISCNVEGEKF